MDRRVAYGNLIEFQKARDGIEKIWRWYHSLPLATRQSSEGALIAKRLSDAQRFVNQGNAIIRAALAKAQKAGYVDSSLRPLTDPPDDFSTGLGIDPFTGSLLLLAGVLAIIVFFMLGPQIGGLIQAATNTVNTHNDLVRMKAGLPSQPVTDPNALNNTLSRGFTVIGLGIAAWVAVTFLRSRRRRAA